jgi:NADPH-dependent 2,4-dienoyl-CoA reductase/sulfur reductase-like enzyme
MLFGNRFATQEVPSREFPEAGMTALDAMRLVAEDLALEGDPARNLATFVTTWMEPEAQRLIAENLHRNFIDHVQMMASDYIKMALAKVVKINPPEPYKLETLTKKILVIGGGITGISAAIDAAKAGYEVTIVEKAALGGKAAKWRKQLPRTTLRNPWPR